MAQRMSDKERAALEAYLSAWSGGEEPDELVKRQGQGVLRRLWPEYYEQLVPKRGRKENPVLRHTVLSRFGVLTHPRMRDEAMRRPYAPAEAVRKIAAELSLSEGYVRRLLGPDFALIKRRKDAEKLSREKERLAHEDRKRQEQRCREEELDAKRRSDDERMRLIKNVYESMFRGEMTPDKICAGIPKIILPNVFDKPARFMLDLDDAHDKAMAAVTKIAGELSRKESNALDEIATRLRIQYSFMRYEAWSKAEKK